MKYVGINFMVDAIVAVIGVMAVYFLGVAIPNYWLYIIIGSYVLGAVLYAVSTELEEKEMGSH